MTLRAIIIGILLGSATAAFGYFNDWIIKQAYLATSLIPLSVFGLLLIGLLVVNPLLKLSGWQLRSGEWAVIAALMLVSSTISSPSLMWSFSNVVVMPHHYNAANKAAWADKQVLDYLPKGPDGGQGFMLIDPGDPDSKEFDAAINGFKGGLPPGPSEVGFQNVPWWAWYKALLFWVPLIALSYTAMIALMTIFHQQWSQREHLRYPIAYVTSELIGGTGQRAFGDIFRNKLFWMGFGIPAVILLINGYQVWEPTSILVPLNMDLSAITQKWPTLRAIPGGTWTFNPTLYFSAVGFAYFVASEVSLSLGISSLLFGALYLLLMQATTIDLSGGGIEGNVFGFQRFGSYLGVLLVILYTGRRFYSSVVTRSIGLGVGERIDRGLIWAFWVGIVAAVVMVAMLTLMVKFSLLLAILFVLLGGVTFIVLTRINVETGLFMIQPGWGIVSVLLMLFGFQAMGPNMFIVAAVLTAALTIDPLVALMPLAANGLKLAETERIRPPRLSKWLALGVVIALVLGMGATIYTQYKFGGGSNTYEWANTIAKGPFEGLGRMLTQEHDPKAWVGLDLSKATLLQDPGQWFSNDIVVAMFIGLAMALGLSMLRLRFTWWPLHPVMLLVWGTFPLHVLAPSFFLGWLLKTGVTTFGGGRTYRSAKPFFIGMIAGEFAASLFWLVIGLIYYLQTGLIGKPFLVYPS